MRDIAGGDNVFFFFTGFPVSFNPCCVLSKVGQWSFSLQYLQRMLSTVPPLFSCHIALPSNHLHFSLSRSLTPKQMVSCSLFSHSEYSECFLVLSSMAQACVMSLGLFSLFRGPWPNLEPPHHSRHCKVTQTRGGAQCYLVSTTPRPFLREKKGGILMKTLGFSGG